MQLYFSLNDKNDIVTRSFLTGYKYQQSNGSINKKDQLHEI